MGRPRSRACVCMLVAFVAVLLAALPQVALADPTGAPSKLTVGGTELTAAGYWVTGENGTLSAGDASSYNVRYDGAGTLALRDATIGGGGIIAETQSGDLGLTILLEGGSTIVTDGGVLLENGNTSTSVPTKTSLAISGPGSLTICDGSVVLYGNNHDSTTSGGTSQDELELLVNNGADMDITTTRVNNYPVVLNGKGSITATFDAATLTTRSASGGGFYSDGSQGSPRIEGIDGAIVRTGWIVSPAPGTSASVVFDDAILIDRHPSSPDVEGRVFGNVTLPGDFSVLSGETLTVEDGDELTIPEGATLTVEQGATLVNHGTVNVEGTVENYGTIECDSHSGGSSVSCDQAVCALCGTVYGAAGPHQWAEPEWGWSADGERFVATFTCEHNASHVEERETVPTATVKVRPTCTEPGVMLYTGTVELDGTEYTATSEAAIPATGHDFVDGVCRNCGAKQPAGSTAPSTDRPADGGIPATGDTSNYVLPIVACVAGIAAVVGAVRLRQTR